MTQDAVRVAVIGYGWWGKIITHTLQESAAVKVVMVVEPDPGVRASAAEAGQKGGFAAAGSIDAAIASPQV